MRRRSFVSFIFGTPLLGSAWLAAQQERRSLGLLAYVPGDGLWLRELPAGQPRCIVTGTGIESPRISPSGRWIAYRQDDNAYVVAQDGSRGARVPGSDFQWRPDRDDLFVEDSSGLQLFEDADVSKAPAISIPNALLPVAFSPDGDEFAYTEIPVTTDDSQTGRICRRSITPTSQPAAVIVDCGKDRPIPYLWMNGDTLLYRLDPDFSGSALSDGLELFAIPASGGQPKSLGVTALLHDDFISVAPAANALAVSAGGGRDACENKRIARVDWRGGGVRYLTGEGTAAVSPAWSPDGKRIAYSAAPAVHNGCGGGDPMRQALSRRLIYVVDASGDSAPAALTGDENYRDEMPQWSPDGRHILFCRVSTAKKQTVWIMRADGSQAEEVAGPLAVEEEDMAWFGYYGTIDWHNVMDWRRV